MRKKTKFFLLRASIILAFTLLAGRLWYVQVVMGSYYTHLGDTSKIRMEPVQALRGIVYDRYGRQLVMNGPSWDAEIVPQGIPVRGAGRVYALLSQLLHGKPSPSAIAAKVHANRWRPYEAFIVKSNISSDTAMIIKQLHLRLPGVRADPSTVRSYVDDPDLSLAHILGYTGTITAGEYGLDKHLYRGEHFTENDQAGQDGIEAQADQYLHGVNGTEEVEVDSGERPVRVLRQGTYVPGDSVYLTIDSRLQRAVSGDLQAALTKLGLRQGVAIVEEVQTGRILAMVSLPSYNNNWFSRGISQARYASLRNDPAYPLNNLAIAGQFPPGSTYKIITGTAALQTGVTSASRIVDDTGLIDLYGQKYYGWQPPPGLGPVNIVSALGKSSDIYFYTMAGGNPNIDPHMPAVGPNRLAQWARNYGLGSVTGIDLPGEQPGLIPSRTWYSHQKPGGPYRARDHLQWSVGDTYNVAIGQGLDLATPLQMVNTVATVANGGTLFQPRVIDHITGRVVPRVGVLRHSRVIVPFVPSPVRRNFISPDNLSLIQQGLLASVNIPESENGTSYEVKDPRFQAAGKTGTAEAPGGPDAWWVGYAPYDHPKIAVVVMMPHADSEGATAAAPVAHKVFCDYFHLPLASSAWLGHVIHFLVPSGRAG